MNPENKKLKEQAHTQKKQQSIQLAHMKKWHALADRCINLWNEYNAGYSFCSRRAFCPLCEPNLKTVTLRKFDRHRCLADNAVVNLKRVPRNFKGSTKKRQTQNV